jgi:hypothetical protein
MTNDKQKRINNNNRKRGGAFEKRVADYLDMDVVPYSGSNARFGYGDVRDSMWLGECKNITPDGNKITIRKEWLTKNLERATNAHRIPFLAWMPAGNANKFIILEYITYAQYFNHIGHSRHIDLDTKFNTKNLIINIDDGWVKQASKSDVIEVAVNGECWYMMSIQKFRTIVNNNGLKGTRDMI